MTKAVILLLATLALFGCRNAGDQIADKALEHHYTEESGVVYHCIVYRGMYKGGIWCEPAGESRG